VILVVVLLLMAGAVAAGAKGTSAKVVGGRITKSFGAASPCTSASVPVAASQGVDLSSRGEELLDAFVGKEGIGDVTLDTSLSTVDIAFCSSLQTEESIRGILNGTGLVTAAPPAPPAAPAEAVLSPSKKSQSVSVETSSGSFSPNAVTVAAGIPTEMSFGGAGGCLTEVLFPKLGIEQDLTSGPITVSLPALEPGTYAFSCAMGHQAGTLTVR